MNNQGFKDAVDLHHISVYGTKDEETIRTWNALLHHILELEHLNDERKKHPEMDLKRCVCDKDRMCDTELYCSFWKGKLGGLK